ncbi:MAG: site-specific integrase, partial [Thermoplasmata archaeon]
MSENGENGKWEKFLDLYLAGTTRKIFVWALKKFFATIYPGVPLAEAVEQYFSKERDYEEDVRSFFITIKNLSPHSVTTLISRIRVFFEENRVHLPSSFYRRLRRRRSGGTQTIDRLPTNEELEKIFLHLPLHARTLFHLLTTSGMRIGAAMSLRHGDVDITSDLVEINVRGSYEKTGASYLAFASGETKELLVEWFKVRTNYLTSAVRQSKHYEKEADDERLFPFSPSLARGLWNEALESTGLGKRDPTTTHHELHPHTLRMRFRTKVGGAGIPVDVAEALVGHKGYLSTYKRFEKEELRMWYKKAESSVNISSITAEIGKVKEDMDGRVDALTAVINNLSYENQTLRKEVVELGKTISSLGVVHKMTRQERFDAGMETLGDKEK